MRLTAALNIHPGEQVAFVGAGGKTSTAWRVLGELATGGHPAVFTTTTRVFEPVGVPLLLNPAPQPTDVTAAMGDPPFLVLAAGRGERGNPEQAARSIYPARPVKLVGLDPARLDELARRLPGVTWLVEADGAKGRELKAPADYEPVIPAGVDRVVLVAGLAALGRPLDDRTVHRPERAAELLGVQLGEPITAETVVRLLTHPLGGLKGVPVGATVVVVLAQGRKPPHPQATTVARGILAAGRTARVVLADLRAHEPVLEVWE